MTMMGNHIPQYILNDDKCYILVSSIAHCMAGETLIDCIPVTG